MSKRDYKRAVEASLRENKPLRVVEPAVKVGRGDTAYKTLTAAVRAAEREKEEARGMVRRAAAQVELAQEAVRMCRNRYDLCVLRVQEVEVMMRRFYWCVLWVVVFLVLGGVLFFLLT